MPRRIPILHLILAVLVLISVVPLYFYADKVVATNRDRLKTNEMLSQNTVTRSMSDQIELRQMSRHAMLANFSSAVEIASGGNITGDHVATPELRALLERFVTSSGDIAYATLLNEDAKGISAGRMAPDVFMQRELERAFAAARDSRDYTGQPLAVSTGKESRTVMLVSAPLKVDTRFLGMIGAVVDLEFVIKRLREADQGGLFTYVVDHQGRLVAAADPSYATGQDMTRFEIVKNFAEQGGKAQFAATREFNVMEGKEEVPMLGTYSPAQTLGWAVVAQKKQKDAYQGVFEMQRSARLWAIFAVLMSIVISFLAARSITRPLDILTESSQAIAKGDFSRRVHLKSRTEFGELADTFNSMSSDLERFVQDLKRAAEENRELFMGSIQMLAGAVDEKDPYTRGHSDRVTKYSVLLAKELGLEPHEVEKIQISAQLHDVGKIGIEDRILKKPGALTPEEFEVMKTHTTKGATILRPVTMLKDMIPGIELHHESLDGRGYPYGLKGDQIPLVARIITVADTFDAMTTNRPYQAAMDPEYVVRIINSLAATKFDPKVVGALTAVFERGDLKIRRAATVQPEAAPAVAGAGGAAPQPVQVAKS
ncbi:MAG: HD domain-containing protein [Acidobacteriia bacterium]|nr:HD domain-containing protein [Terriglobia bacterium]